MQGLDEISLEFETNNIILWGKGLGFKAFSMNAKTLSEHSYLVQNQYNWHIEVCAWVKIVVLFNVKYRQPIFGYIWLLDAYI